jgi:predicted dehydrogenase
VETVGFGVIGLGVGASRARLVTETPGARLVAVCDLNDQRAQAVAAEHEVPWHRHYHELIARNDVNVVLVMTPSGQHATVGVEAARAGKHVVTTKPLDVTLTTADRLISACETAGVMLAVDFQYRYTSDTQCVKRALDAGALGRLILGESRLRWYREQSYYDVGWRGTWALDGGGALMNQSVHFIDLLVWFMGPARSVRGRIGTYAHDIETEDLGTALVTFVSGAQGIIVGTTTYPQNLPATVEVHGDRGGVGLENGRLARWDFVGEPPEREAFSYEGPRNVIEDVTGALRDGRAPLVDGREARKSLEIIRAAYRSAQEGREVRLPLEEGT